MCCVCRAAEGRAGPGRDPGEPEQLCGPGEPLAPRGGGLHPDGGRQGGIHLRLPHCQPPDVLPRSVIYRTHLSGGGQGGIHPVLYIRNFLADPDPGLKSLDPDPSINKLMGSK